MSSHKVNSTELQYLAFLNRENNYRHHYYDEDMLQYEYLKSGDMRSVEESCRLLNSSQKGHLSDDPVRNLKYHVIACITLSTRFAIEGGMESETAYNISDLYIQKLDLCTTEDDVKKLHIDMLTFFTEQMADIQKKHVYSKPVIMCLDYIDFHLHEKITVNELAAYSNLNASYLSSLFKKSFGISITEYITRRRVETAENMLKFSNISYADISSYLAFSSQSYFTQVFKRETGFTPKEYRQRFFRNSLLSIPEKRISP